PLCAPCDRIPLQAAGSFITWEARYHFPWKESSHIYAWLFLASTRLQGGPFYPGDSNGFFWLRKLMANTKRDKSNVRNLSTLGWRVLVVWECQVKREPIENVVSKVEAFLSRSSA